jgi:hypothetical protein
VVLAVVALMGLVGESPNNMETGGRVEVGDAAAIVVVSGGEQAAWGEGGRWVVAQVEVRGSAAAVAAVITPQQLIAAAAIAARAHVVVHAIFHP